MKSNRRQWMGALPAAAVATVAAARGLTAKADNGQDDELVLAFSTMRGSVPNVVINGNASPAPPWVIKDGDGSLSDEGHLNLHVRGLVFANSVPNAGGTNPIPFFRAIVSCTSVDNTGAEEVVNIATGPFPTDVKGNCNINAHVVLPNPCFAPIVFVGPAAPTATPGVITGGTWFAVTGL